MPTEDAGAAELPWTLRAAVGLVTVEAVAEGVGVAGRTELTAGLRTGLVLCVGLKVLFAWRAAHLSPGAVLGLLMLEGTTVVAALGATEADPAVRLALAGVALVVLALLSSSLHAFPSPTLPKG